MINYGQALDTKYRTGGDWVTHQSDGGSWQTQNPYVWDTKQALADGVQFQNYTGQGDISIDGNGNYVGYSHNGYNFAPTSVANNYKAYADQNGLGNYYQSMDAGNGWSAYKGYGGTAPEWMQHGPNNFMERLASYSPYIIGAMAAGAGGMAASGMTGAQASAFAAGEGLSGGAGGAGLTELGSGAVQPLTSAATIAEPSATSTLSQIAQYGNYAGKGLNFAGQMTGNPTLSKIGQGIGLASGGAGGVDSLVNGSGIGDYASGAYKLYGTSQGLSSMINPGNNSFAEGETAGMPNIGRGQTNILDLIGQVGRGYYDSQQLKDYSGNMKNIYSGLNTRQDQFRDPLLASYQNPDIFYGSNQWKGLESVYQNQVDRQAAKGGTLANPTQREVLMQAHAMKALEDWRNGLRQSAAMTSPERALDPLAKGYLAEAYANTPMGAAMANANRSMGANTGTQGFLGVINTLKQAGMTDEQIRQWMSGVNVNGSTAGATPGFGGATFEGDFPMSGGGTPLNTSTGYGYGDLSLDDWAGYF